MSPVVFLVILLVAAALLVAGIAWSQGRAQRAGDGGRLARVEEELARLRREVAELSRRPGEEEAAAVPKAEPRTGAVKAPKAARSADWPIEVRVEPEPESEWEPESAAEPERVWLPEPEPEPKATDEPPRPRFERPPSPPPAPEAPAGSKAAPKAAAPGFEALLGGRVFVWIGAVALALAGAFLVKYSWENQLLSPGQRLLLAAAFGLGLVIAAFPLAKKADRVAAGCAAAGVSTLYGVVFGASSVYGFVGPGLGFVLMGLVTAGAVALSLRFGAFVALLALVGGFLTPALIGPDDGGRGALVAYLVVLQTGLVVITRQRGWVGLSVLTLVGSAAWALYAVIGGGSPTDRLLAGVLTLATAAVFVMNAARLQQAAIATPRRRAGILALAFAAVGAAVTLLGTLAFLQNFSAQELALVAVLSAGTCVLAWFDRRYAALPWLTLGLSLVLAVASSFTLGDSGFWYAVVAGYGGLFALAGYAGSWTPGRGTLPNTASGVTPAARWATLGVLAAAGFAAVAWVLGPHVALMRASTRGGDDSPVWLAFVNGHPLPDWRTPLVILGVPLAMIAAGASLLPKRRRPAGPWLVGGFGLLLGAVGLLFGAWLLPLAFAAVAVLAAGFGRFRRARGVRPHLLWPIAAAAAVAALSVPWIETRGPLLAFPGGSPREVSPRELVVDWLALPLLALTAWWLTGWSGSAAARLHRRPVVAGVEAAAGFVLAVCWLATVRDLVPPGPSERLPYFVTSANQVAWLATGWTLAGGAVLWLRRFGRPAAEAVGSALASAGAVVAVGGLVLVLNPLWGAAATGVGGVGLLGWRWLVPAAALAVVAWWHRDRVERSQALGLASAVLMFSLGMLAIRGWNWGDRPGLLDLDAHRDSELLRLGLKEAACHAAMFAAPGLAALVAADRGLPEASRATVRGFGGFLAGLGAVLALLLVAGLCNPLWKPADLAATPVLTGISFAFGLPAALAAAAAWVLGRDRDEPPAWRKPLRHTLSTVAVVLAFGGISLGVRHAFAYPDLSLGAGVSGSPEWWGYSVAWLLLGVALLAAGVWRASAVLRYASLAVLLLAIGKVFLFDVAALGGLFRVASFLGLGLTLMALGLVYQRFVFATPPAAED